MKPDKKTQNTGFMTVVKPVDGFTTPDNRGKLSEIVTDLCEKLNITPTSKKTLDSDFIQYDDNQKNISEASNFITTKLPNYLGNAAMLGMTVGTATAALKAGTEVMQQLGVLPTIMPKMEHGLEFGANSVFTLSQMAMIAYGLGQAYKGYKQNQNLSKQKELLSNTSDPEQKDPEKTDAINHITQLQKYNRFGNTIYGMGIAGAEAGMIAGNLMGSSPLLLASSLGTLGFAITKIVAQSYQNALTGNGHDHEHNGNPITMLNPWKLPETHLQDANNNAIPRCSSTSCTTEHGNFDSDIKTVNKKYKTNTADLNKVTEKLATVMKHPLNSEYIKQTQNLIESRFNTHKNDEKFSLTFTDALLENSDAKEYVKDILIKELEKDKETNATFLAELRKEGKDENKNELKKIFEDNQGIIDKPEYAKKILMPLLKDALNVLKQKRHHLYNNMAHIQKINAGSDAK